MVADASVHLAGFTTAKLSLLCVIQLCLDTQYSFGAFLLGYLVGPGNPPPLAMEAGPSHFHQHLELFMSVSVDVRS